ncbi:MAG: hypothetical protein NUV81_01210 [bacterium]|nr:hypothetical protein [bacterium]
MNQLIPAILVQDKETFDHHIDVLRGEFDMIQIDVMDGAFVPNRSWFDANVIRSMKSPPNFELHLMVMNPAQIIDTVLDIPHIKRIIWHIEATANHPGLIATCHKNKKEAGLAINPSTPRSMLSALYDDVDELLLMGSEPGFSGRKLDPRAVTRATRIHEEQPTLVLGFDISVNEETIPMLRSAGISRFCSASAIFNAKDPLEEAKHLRNLLS